MTEEDISGIELTVVANKERGEGIKPLEDEWLPSVLVGFTNWESKFGKQLRWQFELLGEEHVWKNKEGETGQFKVSGQSSFSCSPKSKLYKWYAKLTGKEPAEGENIKLREIVGIPCYVMIKINKGKDSEGEPKDYFNVDKVKPRKVEGGGAQIQAPVPEKKPAVVTETQKKDPTPPAPGAGEVKGNSNSEENIFEDIF